MQSSPHVIDLRELKGKLSANKRTMACIVMMMIMMVILNMAIGNDTIGDVSSGDDHDEDNGKMNARRSIMSLRSCFV